MGEAKRRKETGAPPPPKAKSNKPLYAGIGLLVLAAVLLGVFLLRERVSPRILIGAASASIGIVLVNL